MDTTRGTEPRILSLAPSATDWVTDLGLAERFVGVTHACEVPAGAQVDRVVRPAVSPDHADPAAIDDAVATAAGEQRPLYDVDVDAVVGLEPTVILNQSLCDVCAVPSATVAGLVDTLGDVTVVTLDGVTLDGVLADAETVGAALGVEDRARERTASLRWRLAQVADAVAGRRPVPVGLAEWPDPLWLPGHWVPDQIAAAGGRCVAGESGHPSRRGDWSELAEAEVLVVAPCGYGLDDAAAHGVPHVPAHVAANIWAADASRAFSRPSAGVVDGVEALAGILHPHRVGEPDPAVVAWMRGAVDDGATTAEQRQR